MQCGLLRNAMWTTQKLQSCNVAESETLCVGLSPVSVSASRRSPKTDVQLEKWRGAFPWILHWQGGVAVAVAGLEGVLVAGTQGDKAEPNKQW